MMATDLSELANSNKSEQEDVLPNQNERRRHADAPCISDTLDVIDNLPTDENMNPSVTSPAQETVKQPVKAASVSTRADSPTLANSPVDAQGMSESQKAKEREERARLARERREQADLKRREELHEMLARRQEIRRKQEEERRQRMEEMKRRGLEHRSMVEERRRRLRDEENERKEALMRKSAERYARLELQRPVRRNIANRAFGAQSGSRPQSTEPGAAPQRCRPHSLVGWRSNPNYAADTVSSLQLRSGHSAFGRRCAGDGAVVCSRFRSVSPAKGRTQSTGPVRSVRRSRADAPCKPPAGESSESTAQPSAPSSTASATSAASQRLSRVKSMPSKLNADQKAGTPATAAAAATLPSSSVTAARGRTPPAKREATSAAASQATTPTSGAKPMPNAPKTMAPRAIPKEPKSLKEVTTNKPVTSHKVIAKPASKVDSTHAARAKPLEAGVKSSSEKTHIFSAVEVEKEAAAKKSSTTEEDDYKAKLAENRRLAREKAERESAEEQARIEEQRRLEEERRCAEELEQQRREEEELRLAEEARRLEQERYLRAVEEQERRRRDEEDRLELERREKEALEQQAQDEAERREKERQERVQREEHERLERKKKLEMIMKRVKTDEGSLQKSDKSSSPVGSMTEGLNKDSPSESNLTSLVSSGPAVDSDASSRFRSPLLRQMMGGKLATGYRPDVAPSASSTSAASMSSDDAELVETSSETAAPSAGTEAAQDVDEVAVGDEPLKPSPRIPPPPSSYADLVTDETSTAPRRIPIEVWTEETTVDPTSDQVHGDHRELGDVDELCAEDETSKPSPRLELSDRPDVGTSDSRPDQSSSRLDHGGLAERDEPCVEDVPLEPSPRLEVEITVSGKPEEHSSVVDEDRDIDTTETSGSAAKADLPVDQAEWSSVEKVNVEEDSPSGLVNGYPDDSVLLDVKAVTSNEDLTVDQGSGDQVLFDQIIDLADTVGGRPSLGDGTAFADSSSTKSAPLIAFD